MQFSKILFGLICFPALMGCVSSKAGPNERAADAEVKRKIELFEAGKGGYQIIRKVVYDGKPAYIFLPSAMISDGLSRMYEADGSYICSPSGGFGGFGDGSCKGAFGNGQGKGAAQAVQDQQKEK